MTRDDVKALLPILKAYAAGTPIQHYDSAYGWAEFEGELAFDSPPQHYRIKPEPREFYVVRPDSTGPYLVKSAKGFKEVIKVREVLDGE